MDTITTFQPFDNQTVEDPNVALIYTKAPMYQENLQWALLFVLLVISVVYGCVLYV